MIMKSISLKISLVSVALFSAVTVFAQEESKGPWTHSAIAGLNVSQTSLVNWSEGGTGSLASNVYFNGSLDYTKNKLTWNSVLDANLGATKTFEEGSDFRKSMDNLQFSTKIGYTMANKFYYAALADFKTQFANGFEYNPKRKVSYFMTPGYLNLSVGIDYKPSEHLSLYLSPVAGKMVCVSDTLYAENYGIKAGSKTKWELGATFKGSLDYKFFNDKLTLKSTLDLFTPYNDSFGHIDVDWKFMAGYSVVKFLTITLQTNLKYDEDIPYLASDGTKKGPRVQFKEVLGLGVSVQF